MFTQQSHHGASTHNNMFNENRLLFIEIIKYLPALKPWATPSEVANLNYSSDAGDYSVKGRKKAEAIPNTPIKNFGSWLKEGSESLIKAPENAIDSIRQTTARLIDGILYLPSQALKATVTGAAAIVKSPFKLITALTAAAINRVYWAWGLVAQTGTRVIMLGTDMASEGIMKGAEANQAVDIKSSEAIDKVRDKSFTITGSAKNKILSTIGGKNYTPLASNDNKEVLKAA